MGGRRATKVQSYAESDASDFESEGSGEGEIDVRVEPDSEGGRKSSRSRRSAKKDTTESEEGDGGIGFEEDDDDDEEEEEEVMEGVDKKRSIGNDVDDDDDDEAPEEISFTAAHSRAKEVEKLQTETRKSSQQQQKIARLGLSDRQKELVIDRASQPGTKAHVKKVLPDEVLRAMEDKLKRRDKEIRQKRLMKTLREQASMEEEREARANEEDGWMGLDIEGLEEQNEKLRQKNAAAMKREGSIVAVHRGDFVEESVRERGQAMMERAEEFLRNTTGKSGKRVDALTFLSQKMKTSGPSLKFGLKNKRRKRS
eukprot:TRINITY_DN1367_c0_g3_i1.p2 TRINITY_DN1367_c0_g3~~TRINITY_DN1367_c0_g3_i1.p2  ORF type:complete len:312 (+),score=130.70 TRINITY_DN1367_c0_g3_i1:150-1085(+)